MKKYIFPVVAIAALTSGATIWGFKTFSNSPIYLSDSANPAVHYVKNDLQAGTQPVDFTPAAQESVPCVVHIMTLTEGKTVVEQDPFDPFSRFGMARRIPAQMGSGSGVIISSDGYIVTNYHVVQGADKVQVTFNNRNRQIAKVVGTDPSTDLAVLKIDGNNFPYMTFGNSDSLQLGQWVLAVGYPLNLDVTVTAGIVSAKSRSIDVQGRANGSGNSNIDTYIQTDAAVNPGNSGGALVSTNGLLVGINAAIASPTGSFAGYSYAIPSNIVRKVANDIIQHGSVQRGYLGVSVVGLDNLTIESARQLGISKEDFETANGVYVADVLPGSAAQKAGIKKGDFITAINGNKISTSPELLEKVALFHPGDKIQVDYERNNKLNSATVSLAGEPNTQTIAAGSSKGGSVQTLGAQLKALNANDAQKMNLDGGVQVTGLSDGILKDNGVKPGFVIFSINNQPVNSVADVQKYLASSPDNIRIAGMYPGQSGIYYFGLQR